MQCLLIDLDGVLRLWDPEYFSVAERAAGLPHGTIRPTVFAPELLVPAITGRTSDQTWRRLARDTLQARFPGANAQLAIDLWSESAGTVDQSVLDLVRQCRKVAKVGLVTNATSRLRTDLVTLGLLDEFDLIVNSSEVGCVKPDPDIYRWALRALEGTPEETLFVDDSPANVEGAVRVGMAAHLYESPEGLRDALCRQGLL